MTNDFLRIGMFCFGTIFSPFFFTSSLLQGQPPSEYRIKKITGTATGGNKMEEVFEYNEKGRPVKIVRSTGFHSTYIYNEQDQLIKYSGFDDSGAAVSCEYTYGNQGHITEIVQKKTVMLQHQSITVVKKANYKMETIGGKNRLTHLTRYKQSGSEWKVNEMIQFAYHADGRLAQMDITVIFSGNPLRTTFIIEQIAGGNVKAIEIYEWHNDVKVKSSEEHFTYHPFARSIESLRLYPEKDFDPGVLMAAPFFTTSITTKKFDDTGKLMSNKKELFDTPVHNEEGLLLQQKSPDGTKYDYEWERLVAKPGTLNSFQ